MNLQRRIDLLVDLSNYMSGGLEEWSTARQKASEENTWFTQEFIQTAIINIVNEFLSEAKLTQWCDHYPVPEEKNEPKTVGLVMAGNIPLVGFHDFLSIFISGNKQIIKASSKDEVLIKHIVDYLISKEPRVKDVVGFAEMLKGCDAYIATGSNNSARYFQYYFGKYPSIIRRTRTSAAILGGNETIEELQQLTSDISLYFGRGCRSVTKIFIPVHYDFLPLLQSLEEYQHFTNHHKYINNYDYQLAMLILNNKYYMTNGSILLTENTSLFSPISVLHYEFYHHIGLAEEQVINNKEIQCIIGKNYLPFGSAQRPTLTDYADGKDTMEFLATL